jgi:hypothetical protein
MVCRGKETYIVLTHSSMGITPTIDDGFYVTHVRHGERMSRRCLTREHAEECFRSMCEDVVVDLPRVRFYFQENQILILRKPHLTDPRWKGAYEST